jgi:antitoxin VapB
MDTARLFWSGGSQAVRLPNRFDGETVRIRRRGHAVILEPIPKDWSWLDAIAGRMSDDFMADGRGQPPVPDQPEPTG